MFVKEHFVRQFAQCSTTLIRKKFQQDFYEKMYVNLFWRYLLQQFQIMIVQHIVSYIYFCTIFEFFEHCCVLWCRVRLHLLKNVDPNILSLIHFEKKQLLKTLQFIISRLQSTDIMKIKINSSCAAHLCPLPQQVLD